MADRKPSFSKLSWGPALSWTLVDPLSHPEQNRGAGRVQQAGCHPGRSLPRSHPYIQSATKFNPLSIQPLQPGQGPSDSCMDCYSCFGMFASSFVLVNLFSTERSFSKASLTTDTLVSWLSMANSWSLFPLAMAFKTFHHVTQPSLSFCPSLAFGQPRVLLKMLSRGPIFPSVPLSEIAFSYQALCKGSSSMKPPHASPPTQLAPASPGLLQQAAHPSITVPELSVVLVCLHVCLSPQAGSSWRAGPAPSLSPQHPAHAWHREVPYNPLIHCICPQNCLVLLPSYQVPCTYSFKTTSGEEVRTRKSIIQPPHCPEEQLWQVQKGHPPQVLGAEISIAPSLGCLGEINGVPRRVVGIFKSSSTQCQQKQTWKQMAMTRRAFTLERA